MKINKKIILGASTVAAIAAPVSFVVSCGQQSFSSRDYDFGIAIPPINSLNYIKNSGSLSKILPSLITSTVISYPSKALKNQLQLPDFDSILNVNNNGSTNAIAFPLSLINRYPGLISNRPGSLQIDVDTSYSVGAFKFRVGKSHKWKGASNPKYNRVITPQDYIDYIEYIADINTGSEYLKRIRNVRIIGIEDLYKAQLNYATKYGKTYSKPFGVNPQIDMTNKTITNKDTAWKSQISGDDSLVDEIRKAATKFLTQGMFVSGQSAHDEFLNINFERRVDVDSALDALKNYFLPVNKEFVESVGGVEKFGTSIDKFIYTGAFDIDDIRLGQGGYMILTKDKGYETADWTISNKIKVYFQDDQNILSAMFRDKYISATNIASDYQKAFWAEADTRQFMKKVAGTGTLSLEFNINDTTNSPVKNQNLRNAISHAINKSDMLKLLNWDSSFPVATWTPKTVVKTSDGLPYDAYADLQKYKDPMAQSPQSLTTTKFQEHDARNYNFEMSDRHDNRFSVDIARKYFEQWKKETGRSSVELQFLASDASSLASGLGIKTMLRDAFGGGVTLNIKQVPSNAYESMRKAGQFDITTYNFDGYGSEIDSYIKRLFFEDSVDPSRNKTDGFEDNPTGSWTFHKWYEENKANINDIKTNVALVNASNEDVWNKVIEMFAIDPNADNKDLHDKLTKIWTKKDNVINSENKLFEFASLIEKIIAISSPIVPILEVDNNWTISRIGGIASTYTYDLQFGYDVLNKPSPNLPGKESL